MFNTFYPDAYLASTYVINFEELYEKGYRGIIFDVDNTLVPHGAPADKRALDLFDRLRKIGFDTCLISNNQEPRVRPFAEAVKSKYVFNAHKPSRKNYRKAMKLMGTDVETILCGRSAFYRCVGGKKNRNEEHFSKSNSSKGRNSNCS